MYYMDAEGKRVYTLKKENPEGQVTYSAHPGKEGRKKGWTGSTESAKWDRVGLIWFSVPSSACQGRATWSWLCREMPVRADLPSDFRLTKSTSNPPQRNPHSALLARRQVQQAAHHPQEALRSPSHAAGGARPLTNSLSSGGARGRRQQQICTDRTEQKCVRRHMGSYK